MIVCIAHPLGDLLNLDFRIQKQLPGTFHAYLKNIFIDATVISGFELAGQIFFGKEIFVGKLGDLDVAAVVFVDIIMDDRSDSIGVQIRFFFSGIRRCETRTEGFHCPLAQ